MLISSLSVSLSALLMIENCTPLLTLTAIRGSSQSASRVKTKIVCRVQESRLAITHIICLFKTRA